MQSVIVLTGDMQSMRESCKCCKNPVTVADVLLGLAEAVQGHQDGRQCECGTGEPKHSLTHFTQALLSQVIHLLRLPRSMSQQQRQDNALAHCGSPGVMSPEAVLEP